MEVNPHYKNYTIDQFTVQDLERLDPVDIEEYQEYLKSIRMKKIVRSQILKKDFPVKCLHSDSFYGYYFKRQIISKNPTLLV